MHVLEKGKLCSYCGIKKKYRQCMLMVTLALSPNHCCNGNATVRSVCVVELHVIVNSTRILSVAQQSLCGEFMSPSTIKPA